MRLSEAIRLGAMLRPQEYKAVFAQRDGEWYSCAIGAIAEAVGQKPNNINEGLFRAVQSFPILNSIVGTYPCDCGQVFLAGGRIWHIISHLNNSHRWTRERIAAWVATIEPQELESPVEANQTQQAEQVAP